MLRCSSVRAKSTGPDNTDRVTRAGAADGKVDVLVVGSVNRDLVCRVETLPAPGETVLAREVSVGSGGKGGNQAVAASLLGARTALVARVGDDGDGHALTAVLAEAGVDAAEVATTDLRTGMAFVFVDAQGENSIVVAPGANELLDPASVEDAVRRRLTTAGVLVTQAEIPVPAFDAAIRTAAEMGCRVVVNLAPYRPVDGDVLALCDPLVVNESEASGLLGRQVRRVAGARDAVSDLLRRCGSVVVTVGGEGAVVADADGVHVVAAPQVDVVDSTGAGDAFTGAMAAALSAGHDLSSAVRIAVRAGAHAVTRPGAQGSFASAAELGIGRLRAGG
jgi:ribokinase